MQPFECKPQHVVQVCGNGMWGGHELLLPVSCWKGKRESPLAARPLPSAKCSRHSGIYLSSNSATVDFSTKQRFRCPASLKKKDYFYSDIDQCAIKIQPRIRPKSKMRGPKFNICANLPRSDVPPFKVYSLAICSPVYTSYICINTIFSLFTSYCLFADE